MWSALKKLILMSSFAGLAGLSGLSTLSAQRASVPAADAAAGKGLFETKGGCTACHSIEIRDGTFGPALGWIGLLRTPSALRQSLINPDADVHPRFFTVSIETKAGQKFEGLGLNEDDLSIQIRDTAHENRSFLKSGLKTLQREPRSLMPSYATRLSATEIDQLVAYLSTLRTLWPLEPGERTREIGTISENITFFNRPDRAEAERTDDLIKALEIPEGARIADIGAGTGYFTWRLAQQVGPRGKVMAIDIQQQMLDLAAETVRTHNLANVEYVLAGDNDPKLPERSLDLVFIGHSYHEFAEPEAIMAAVKRSLKPDGRLVVVEYAKEIPEAPASSLHKMSFDEMRGEIEPMGFELMRILDFLPVQHGLIFIVHR
jgi:putative heme-binding domain-containing protein